MALFMDGVQLPQGQNENHFEVAVYFLPFKFPEIAGTHFLSISEGQTTQILKSDPKGEVSVVPKILFPQMKVPGYTTLVSDTKISKLIL